MRNCRRITHCVEHRTATNSQNIRMAIDTVAVYRLNDTVYTFTFVLDGLATRNHQDITYQLYGGIWVKIISYPLNQRRMVSGYAFVNRYQQFWYRPVQAFGKEAAQQTVLGGKQSRGKIDIVLVRNRKFLLDNSVHLFIFCF